MVHSVHNRPPPVPIHMNPVYIWKMAFAVLLGSKSTPSRLEKWPSNAVYRKTAACSDCDIHHKSRNVRMTQQWGAFAWPPSLWKSNKCYIFWVYVSGLSYTACKAHTLFHLRPIWLFHIFPHYLINGTIFGTKLLNIKCVLIFSTTFVWKISHSKKNLARYHICT